MGEIVGEPRAAFDRLRELATEDLRSVSVGLHVEAARRGLLTPYGVPVPLRTVADAVAGSANGVFCDGAGSACYVEQDPRGRRVIGHRARVVVTPLTWFPEPWAFLVVRPGAAPKGPVRQRGLAAAAVACGRFQPLREYVHLTSEQSTAPQPDLELAASLLREAEIGRLQVVAAAARLRPYEHEGIWETAALAAASWLGHQRKSA